MACPDWCDGSCAECLNLEDELVRCPACGQMEICEEKSYYGGYICGVCKDAEEEALDKRDDELEAEEEGVCEEYGCGRTLVLGTCPSHG